MFYRHILTAIVITFANAMNTCTVIKQDYGNQCVQFSVSSGTGCAWMCDYCANHLGTNNYYFPDGVCTYLSLIHI